MKERESILLAIAIGDAYGRVFEFATEDFIEKNNKAVQYHERTPTKQRVKIGRYTDDTQMTIAIGEFMLSKLPPSQSNIMKYFMMAAQRQEVRGYTRGMTELLKMKTAKAALDAIASKPARKSNGCVMRAIPIGFINDPSLVAHYSIMQCITTHPDADCIFATQFLALMVHYYLYLYKYEYPFLTLENFIDIQLGKGSYDRMYYHYHSDQGPIQVDAMQTVSFCLQTVSDYDNMSEILHHSVAVGGDVDSTASICMGLAVALGKKNDLNNRLYANLRNDEYGKKYIIDIEKAIKQLPICQKLIQPTASTVSTTST